MAYTELFNVLEDIISLDKEHRGEISGLTLFDKDMIYQKIGRTIAETEFCRNQERLTALMYHSQQKRYEDFLKNMSKSVLILPQHLLANYLGVTKETLSRIRARGR